MKAAFVTLLLMVPTVRIERFVGRVTNSGSFMSCPRHEYFRRTLCSLLGRTLEAGEMPGDFAPMGKMVRSISHDNTQAYFCFTA